MSEKTRVVILGGGFGGVYTALEMERLVKGRTDIEVTLVNQENFLLFTPMLHEIAASDLDPTDIVNPIHKLLRRVEFFCGSTDGVDIAGRTVTVSHGASHHTHVLPFDHLVVAVGSVTQFFGNRTLEEHSLTMKSLGDAIHLRNRAIALLEEANFECCADIRRRLLTFVVAGAGFAGVETIAALHDFTHGVLSCYPNLSKGDLRFVLACSGKKILPELHERLGSYAGEILERRGIEIRYETKVGDYDGERVTLSDRDAFETSTVVWTAGTCPNPLLAEMPLDKERGRLLVNEFLRASGEVPVWAVGDCAAIPNGAGGFHPPTAQHAIREARTAARNIMAIVDGAEPRPFRFKTLGQLASLGHRKGVAQVFGFRFSGFIAWWMWRSIYLMKLPRFEKRLRVVLNWTLDVLFSKDTVQLPVGRGRRDSTMVIVGVPAEVGKEAANR